MEITARATTQPTATARAAHYQVRPLASWLEIPNHEGYDYLQRQLAGMGIVAASVYLNETNCTAYTTTNIRHRAELILASIAHFRALTTGGDPIFGGRIDLGRVGLMGHSRSGEAVIVAPDVAAIPDLRIRAVLSLAPTDAGASSGRPRLRHACDPSRRRRRRG